jgi:acyl-CoA reductase-like NAD-dependent aldehyde dehydrogenase
VLCILGYEDLDQGAAIANDTDHGLGAYMQAASDEAALAVAERLEAAPARTRRRRSGVTRCPATAAKWGAMAFQEFVEVNALIRREAA